MKTLVIGIHLTGGIGKESGREFKFPPKAYITNPLELVDGDKYWRKGHGHEPVEVEVSHDAYNQLAAYKDKFPCVLNVETGFRNDKGRPVVFISGVTEAKAA